MGLNQANPIEGGGSFEDLLRFISQQQIPDSERFERIGGGAESEIFNVDVRTPLMRALELGAGLTNLSTFSNPFAFAQQAQQQLGGGGVPGLASFDQSNPAFALLSSLGSSFGSTAGSPALALPAPSSPSFPQNSPPTGSGPGNGGNTGNDNPNPDGPGSEDPPDPTQDGIGLPSEGGGELVPIQALLQAALLPGGLAPKFLATGGQLDPNRLNIVGEQGPEAVIGNTVVPFGDPLGAGQTTTTPNGNTITGISGTVNPTTNPQNPLLGTPEGLQQIIAQVQQLAGQSGGTLSTGQLNAFINNADPSSANPSSLGQNFLSSSGSGSADNANAFLLANLAGITGQGTAAGGPDQSNTFLRSILGSSGQGTGNSSNLGFGTDQLNQGLLNAFLGQDNSSLLTPTAAGGGSLAGGPAGNPNLVFDPQVGAFVPRAGGTVNTPPTAGVGGPFPPPPIDPGIDVTPQGDPAPGGVNPALGFVGSAGQVPFFGAGDGNTSSQANSKTVPQARPALGGPFVPPNTDPGIDVTPPGSGGIGGPFIPPNTDPGIDITPPGAAPGASSNPFEQSLGGDSPENQAFQQGLATLQNLLGNAQGGNVVEALRPVFESNLRQSLGQLTSSVPSVFNSATGTEAGRVTEGALQQFNLDSANAVQQGIGNQLQGLNTLGGLAGQAGNSGFQRGFDLLGLSQQQQQFNSQFGLAQNQQAFDQLTGPTLQLLLAALASGQPTAGQTVVGAR